MALIYLIRHGQASLGKEDYDNLSELGKEQSVALGEYFCNTNINFTRVITGTLKRHIQTADGILGEDRQKRNILRNAAWNEFNFKALVKAYLKSPYHKGATPSDTKAFFVALKQAMIAWQSGNLEVRGMESWLEFQTRISSALAELSDLKKNERALVVTSGGAISMAFKILYDFSAHQMIDLNLEIKNTSLSIINVKKDRMVMAGFNGTPHLDQPSRSAMITYV